MSDSPNPYALVPSVRAKIIRAAQGFAGGIVTTVSFYGTKEPGAWEWYLGEVCLHWPDGRTLSYLAEQVFDAETGGGLTTEWEAAEKALDRSVNDAACMLDAAEPWLAVVDVHGSPKVVWRVTTVTPISYDHYSEIPAD